MILNERQGFFQQLSLNKSLAKAYYLKEVFHQVWSQGSKEEAAAYIDWLIARARSSDFNLLIAFPVTAYYDFPISTGLL